MSSSIDQIISERTANYGAFVGVAELSQTLKQAVGTHIGSRGAVLAPDQMEALEMILHKIARIANGNPDYADSWEDVAGYATLVAERLATEHRCQNT